VGGFFVLFVSEWICCDKKFTTTTTTTTTTTKMGQEEVVKTQKKSNGQNQMWMNQCHPESVLNNSYQVQTSKQKKDTFYSPPVHDD